MALSPLQRRFVEEYLLDLNGKQAAIRAGYSPHSAKMKASQLLAMPAIQEAIDAAKELRADRVKIDADNVLAKIAEIAFADIRKMFGPDNRLLRPSEWDDETAAAVAGLEIFTVSKGEGEVEHVAKIKRADRLRALDQLARHLGIYNDKIDVNGSLYGLGDRLERAIAHAENPPHRKELEK